MKLFYALLAVVAIVCAASQAEAGGCPGGNCSLNRTYYSQPAYTYSTPAYSQPVASSYSHAAYKPVVTQSAPAVVAPTTTSPAKTVSYAYPTKTYYYYPSTGYTQSTCSSRGYCR